MEDNFTRNFQYLKQNQDGLKVKGLKYHRCGS